MRTASFVASPEMDVDAEHYTVNDFPNGQDLASYATGEEAHTSRVVQYGDDERLRSQKRHYWEEANNQTEVKKRKKR